MSFGIDRRVSLFLFFAILLITTLMYLTATPGFSRSMLWCVVGLAVTAVFVFSITQQPRCLDGKIFRPTVFFIIGFLATHFQLYIDVLLGYSDTSAPRLANSDMSNICAPLSLAGLVAFFIGYCWLERPTKNSVRQDCVYTPLAPSIVLVVVCAVLFYSTVNWSFFWGGHIARMDKTIGEDAAMGTIGQYTNLIFSSSLMIPLFFHLKNIVYRERVLGIDPPKSIFGFLKGFGPVYLSALGSYVLLMTTSGQRSTPLGWFLLFGISYFCATKKKFSKILFLGLLVVGSIVMFMIGSVRGASYFGVPLTEKVRIASEAVADNFFGDKKSNETIFVGTAEFSGQVYALHKVVEAVPSHYNYCYGRMALSNITSAIPFLNRFLTPIIYTGMIPGSAQYATYIDQGDNVYYGIGTSTVTEFYFDGGIVAVIIGSFIMGLFFRNVELGMFGGYNLSLFWTACAMCIFQGCFFMARGGFVGMAKGVLYIMVLSVILSRLSGAQVFRLLRKRSGIVPNGR